MDRAEQRLPVVDGLRAFAVIAVVLFHGFPTLVGGGFIGVDIFFVISGFVIALRYLEPMVAREVGYRTFFLRRVRRLVPAYFAMLVAATLAAAWVMVPRDLINFGDSLVGQAFYAQNIVFWVQGEYFDAALLKPLLHTWSLGVEEQFYLCFPLLVLALRRWPRATIVACALLSLATLGAGAVIEEISAKTAFYWLPFRIWEFLAGIGAAMLFRSGVGKRVPRGVANGAALIAVAAIGIAVLLFDNDTASVLAQGLPAVVATAALCLMQEQLSPWFQALFTNRLAQHLGRISYSWYLWHWPPLVFAYLALGHVPDGWEAVGLTLLGYLLGLVSWRLFERGASRSVWLAPPARTIGLLVAFLVFAAAAGAALIASHGLLQRYPVAERPLLLAQMDRPDGRCPFSDRLRHWRGQVCRLTRASGPGGILLIGDSHAEMQKDVLTAMGDRTGVPVYLAVQNCVIVDYGVDRNCKWHVWRSIAADIRAHHISRIIAIALWPDHFDRAVFDQAVARLLTSGARVVLERPTPRDTTLAPAFYIDHPDAWRDLSLYPRAAHEAAQHDLNEAMTDWARRDPRVTLLDPIPELCPGDRCLFARESHPLYSDTHHLTQPGVHVVAPIYEPVFAAAARERIAAAK